MKLLVMSAFLFCFSLAVQAQTAQPASANIYIPPKPLTSEDNAVRMEYVRNLMTAEPNPNGVIIVIARLGRGETRKRLNYRRLFNVKERYKVALGIPAEKIVTAEGERVNDYGRVEIYWNGKLAEALPAERNTDLYVTCCGVNELYYPHKQTLKGRRKRN